MHQKFLLLLRGFPCLFAGLALGSLAPGCDDSAAAGPRDGGQVGMDARAEDAAEATSDASEMVDAPRDCTLERLERDFFTPTCGVTGCHGGPVPAGGLNLAAPGVAARVVDVPAAGCAGRILVVPGDSSASFLYEKLTSAVPQCGSRMPLVGSAPADLVACLGEWIDAMPLGGDAGAPDGGLLDGGTADAGMADGAVLDGDVMDGSPDLDAGECASGLMRCGGACVDTQTDSEHCGVCMRRCGPVRTCIDGACVSTCGTGLTDCGPTCVDTDTNPLHCGGCDMPCAPGLVCSAGLCECAPGTMLCSGVCLNIGVDPANCGGCGVMCGAGRTCVGGSCELCGASPGFAASVQPIFETTCATVGCHEGPFAAGGMRLSAGSAYGEIVDVASAGCLSRTRVVPGRTDLSYLLEKLTSPAPCAGSPMPLAGSVTPAEIAAIAEWICAGAPND